MRRPNCRPLAPSDRIGLVLGLAASVLSVAIGLPLAWAVSRTNVPGKPFIHLTAVVSYLTPPFRTAIAFVNLFSPRAGLINRFFRDMLAMPVLTFDVFSMAGSSWSRCPTRFRSSSCWRRARWSRSTHRWRRRRTMADRTGRGPLAHLRRAHRRRALPTAALSGAALVRHARSQGSRPQLVDLGPARWGSSRSAPRSSPWRHRSRVRLALVGAPLLGEPHASALSIRPAGIRRYAPGHLEQLDPRGRHRDFRRAPGPRRRRSRSAATIIDCHVTLDDGTRIRAQVDSGGVLEMGQTVGVEFDSRQASVFSA